MNLRSAIARIVQQEDLNFLLTNRIPRRWLTQFLGWFSKVEQPFVRDASLALWKLFSDLDLSEARKTHFKSLHDCFTRELKDGARPIDPDPTALVSPCDAIIGASGAIVDGCLLQAKGFPYTLESLLGAKQRQLATEYLGGSYVTLRLTSSMYHRFHAPYDCRVEQVTYISGDTWNVNPIALKRIKYGGPSVIPCDAKYRKGEEMGWFQHGSTIIVLAPPGVSIRPDLSQGERIRMGQPLLNLSG
jgi:phosphatidylserine decarboxylase